MKTTKGNPVLHFEGFVYRLAKTNLTTKNWRCLKRNCSGSASTDLESSQPVALKPHNHLEDPEKVICMKTSQKMREEAASSTISIPQIYRQNVAGKNIYL